jgi:hypothetical protein
VPKETQGKRTLGGKEHAGHHVSRGETEARGTTQMGIQRWNSERNTETPPRPGKKPDREMEAWECGASSGWGG